jgi:hypothetical protein
MVREVPTTRQPRSRRVWVNPKPMPLEAPVTMATGCSIVFIRAFPSCFGLSFFGKASVSAPVSALLSDTIAFVTQAKHRLCELRN